MSYNNKVSNNYLEQEIRSEDPLALTARVYRMACADVTRARNALRAGNMAAKGAAVHRASRCIALLQSWLDLDRGGEVALNLDRLYGYFQRRLTEAHLDNSHEAFAEVQNHLEELGGAWQTVAGRSRQAVPPGASPETPAAPVEAAR